jgi:hypothetical protein
MCLVGGHMLVAVLMSFCISSLQSMDSASFSEQEIALEMLPQVVEAGLAQRHVP